MCYGYAINLSMSKFSYLSTLNCASRGERMFRKGDKGEEYQNSHVLLTDTREMEARVASNHSLLAPIRRPK